MIKPQGRLWPQHHSSQEEGGFKGCCGDDADAAQRGNEKLDFSIINKDPHIVASSSHTASVLWDQLASPLTYRRRNGSEN